MPEKRRSLLDSSALLAFLTNEPGVEKVKNLLRAARKSQPLLMNEINVGEVYYVLAKSRSTEHAERFLHTLATLPIESVGNSFADVMEAAKIKALFPISYGDAFVVASAMRFKAVVVTADREFEAVSHLVKIDWL